MKRITAIIISTLFLALIMLSIDLATDKVAANNPEPQTTIPVTEETSKEEMEEIATEVPTEQTTESPVKLEDVDILGKVESMIQAELEKEEEERKFREQKVNEYNSKVADLPADKYEWYVGYKGLLEEYAQWIEIPVTIYDVYTPDEIYLMQRCVETECYQESFNAKANVASVIFNRIAHKGFPNNVWDVITTPRQFVYSRTEIAADTVLALEYAFMFNQMHPNVLFFHSDKLGKQESFNGALYYCSDDAVHHFYIVN